MRKIIFMLLLAMVLGGCAKKPVIQDNVYKSLEHSFQTTTPAGWKTSFNKPDWLPDFLTPDNSRYTERVFITNPTTKSCVMVESKQLTWAKKKIHPVDVQFDPSGQSRFVTACNRVHDIIKNNVLSSGRASKYEYSCVNDPMQNFCPINNKCLTSEVNALLGGNSKYFMKEANYVAGEKTDVVKMTNGEWPTEAWRINYILYAPTSKQEEGEKALNQIIKSTTEI